MKHALIIQKYKFNKKQNRDTCNIVQFQHVVFFSQINRLNLTENRFFIRFYSVGPNTVSLHGKICLNFRNKFCVSLSIKHRNPLDNNIVLKKKVSIAVPTWKNTLKPQKI